MTDVLPADAAIIVLGPGGLELAERLRSVLPGARIHGLAGRVTGTDESFAETGVHIGALFRAGVPIVGICAAGIVIRALAGAMTAKQSDPPVLAVAEDGSSVVPLLGGHHGANAMARAIAAETGGLAAITTAGDVRYGLALDAPPAGWRVANEQAAKAVTADLLAGVPVALNVEAGEAGWLTESGAPFEPEGARSILVTDRAGQESADTLVLHPPVLALGVGCERGAAAGELIALAQQTLAAGGLAAGAVACVVSLDLKSDEAAVLELADHLGVPPRFFSAPRLEAETPRLANPSDIVFAEVGCHGVAEGAALAAAADGELTVAKIKSARATCAIARSASGIYAQEVGRARGSLAIVGIGPGAAQWRTPEATAMLAAAEDIVGYRLYLDLIAGLIAGKNRHESPLGEEEARVRKALDLAAEGRAVALVSSGDPGIYALATLVFELIDGGSDAWGRLEVTVAPGISALQAAAARIGAPLGHDFCTVSLSDLLTPWEVIENRLRAAADGDFVVALYNPASNRRRHQLGQARDILLAKRQPTTPVVLARNLGRDGETVETIALADLSAEKVDMLTLVLIGNGQTRVVEAGQQRWVYTPRGYAAKRARNREAS